MSKEDEIVLNAVKKLNQLEELVEDTGALLGDIKYNESKLDYVYNCICRAVSELESAQSLKHYSGEKYSELKAWTDELALYIRGKGINIRTISNAIGADYRDMLNCLDTNLTHRRPLQLDEYLSICRFLCFTPRIDV